MDYRDSYEGVDKNSDLAWGNELIPGGEFLSPGVDGGPGNNEYDLDMSKDAALKQFEAQLKQTAEDRPAKVEDRFNMLSPGTKGALEEALVAELNFSSESPAVPASTPVANEFDLPGSTINPYPIAFGAEDFNALVAGQVPDVAALSSSLPAPSTMPILPDGRAANPHQGLNPSFADLENSGLDLNMGGMKLDDDGFGNFLDTSFLRDNLPPNLSTSPTAMSPGFANNNPAGNMGTRVNVPDNRNTAGMMQSSLGENMMTNPVRMANSSMGFVHEGPVAHAPVANQPNFSGGDRVLDELLGRLSKHESMPEGAKPDRGSGVDRDHVSSFFIEDDTHYRQSRRAPQDTNWNSESESWEPSSSARSAGRRVSPGPASRFCHICSRTEKTARHVTCANFELGECRKITCEKCFKTYGWDWESASAPGRSWVCTHCLDNCPVKARCKIYEKVNSRRRERSKERRRRTPSVSPGRGPRSTLSSPRRTTSGGFFSEPPSPL
ncbi:hypothetical protein NDN08_000491 [Rhodosorus marinus]|uniref:Zinc-finger domain-containing protein n=1 Tax=Rhodosorus marinus TaxID=101924 RepID=A0AAV8UN28_9RHOD|nr:hypothetical protein NDN08_000491 [Rhodosorus marinus]